MLVFIAAMSPTAIRIHLSQADEGLQEQFGFLLSRSNTHRAEYLLGKAHASTEIPSLLISRLWPSDTVDEAEILALTQEGSIQVALLEGWPKALVEKLRAHNVPVVISLEALSPGQLPESLAPIFLDGLLRGQNYGDAYEAARDALRKSETAAPPTLYLRNEGKNVLKLQLGEALTRQEEETPAAEIAPKPVQEKPATRLDFPWTQAYTSAQQPLFFGRDAQSRSLYASLTAPECAPFFLLHGTKGVGKTSLVRAGLWPMLRHDASVLFSQSSSTSDIKAQILKQIQEENYALENQLNLGNLNFGQLWHFYEEQSERPLILVLDHLSLQAQRYACQSMLENLAQVFQQQPLRGNVLLVLPSEEQSEVQGFLQAAGVPTEHQEVRPLGLPEVKAAFLQVAEKDSAYALSAKVEHRLPEAVAQEMQKQRDPLGKHFVFQQILSVLWEAANQENHADKAPTLTLTQFKKIQKEGTGLAYWLYAKLKEIYTAHQEELAIGFLVELLFFFVDKEEESLLSRTENELKRTFGHNEIALSLGLAAFEKAALLVQKNTKGVSYSLQSESLVHPLLQMYERADFDAQRAKKLLEAKLNAPPQPETNYLSPQEAAYIEATRPQMPRLTERAERLLADSKRFHRKRERRKSRFSFLLIFLIFIVLGGGGAVYLQWLQYEEQLESERQRQDTQKADFLAFIAEREAKEQPAVALRLAQKATEVAPTKAALSTLYANYFKAEPLQHLQFTAPKGATILSSCMLMENKVFIQLSNGQAEIWNAVGEMEAQWKTPAPAIATAALDTLVFSAYENGELEARTLTGEEFWVQKAHSGGVNALFADAGRGQILSAGADSTVAVWSASGLLQYRLEGHNAPVISVESDTEGKIFSLDDSGVLAQWEATQLEDTEEVSSKEMPALREKNALLRRTESHKFSSAFLADYRFSKEGESYAIYAKKEEKALWESTKKQTFIHGGNWPCFYDSATHALHFPTFLAGETMTFTLPLREKALKIKLKRDFLQLETPEEVQIWKIVPRAPLYALRSALAFCAKSPDENFLMLSDIEKKNIAFVSLADSLLFHTDSLKLPAALDTFYWLEDQKHALLQLENREVFTYNLYTKKQAPQAPLPEKGEVQFSPTAALRLVQTDTKTILLSDSSGAQKAEFKALEARFLPHSNIVLTQEEYGVGLWTEEGDTLHYINGFAKQLAISPAGERLALSRDGKQFELLSLKGEVLFQHTEKQPAQVKVSPDGLFLLFLEDRPADKRGKPVLRPYRLVDVALEEPVEIHPEAVRHRIENLRFFGEKGEYFYATSENWTDLFRTHGADRYTTLRGGAIQLAENQGLAITFRKQGEAYISRLADGHVLWSTTDANLQAITLLPERDAFLLRYTNRIEYWPLSHGAVGSALEKQGALRLSLQQQQKFMVE